MNKKIIFSIVLLLVILMISGCKQIETQTQIKPYECQQDSDCLATCTEPGCYNKDYFIKIHQGRDCEALILHTCKCVNNVCTKF